MARFLKFRKSAVLPDRAPGGQVRLYLKSDETLETVDDEGNREPVGSGDGGGEQSVYVQPTDPALEPGWTNGVGKIWVDTTEDVTAVRRRNFDDDGWVDLFESYQAVSGVQIAGFPGGVGEDGGDSVLVGGSGDDGANPGARITAGAGTTEAAGRLAFRTNGGNGTTGEVLVRHVDGGLVYGDLTDISRSTPEVPATPTEQDIVDALLALGLVTQAP